MPLTISSAATTFRSHSAQGVSKSRYLHFGRVILAISPVLFGAPARPDPRTAVDGIADAIRAIRLPYDVG